MQSSTSISKVQEKMEKQKHKKTLITKKRAKDFLLLCHVRKWNLCLSLLCGVTIVCWTPWCIKISKKKTVCVWTATWENNWRDNFIRRHVIGGLVLHLQIHLQNCGSLACTLCQLGNMGFIYLLFGGVLSDARRSGGGAIWLE